MFGLFNRKRPLVYEQWIAPILVFSSDTAKFYAAVEAELEAQEVPQLVTERQVFRDGGFLSSGREYLRVRREGVVFDILSAKFGRNWWFSSRSALLRRSLRGWEIAVFLLGVAAFGASYWYSFGYVVGGVALGLTLLMMLVMMVSARSWNGLDDLLLKLPVIGAFYESIFRAESYYRDDARRMFVSVVDHVVREQVKEFAAVGGVEDIQFNSVSDIRQVTSLMERVRELAAGAASNVSVSKSE